MEFLKHLIVDEETRLMWDMPHTKDIRFRRFAPVKFKTCLLSIQASAFHYCTPQDTFTNPSIYSHMELAVLQPIGRGKMAWVDVIMNTLFSDFKQRALFKEYENTVGLYAYIPVELIEALFQYLTTTDIKGSSYRIRLGGKKHD